MRNVELSTLRLLLATTSICQPCMRPLAAGYLVSSGTLTESTAIQQAPHGQRRLTALSCRG